MAGAFDNSHDANSCTCGSITVSKQASNRQTKNCAEHSLQQPHHPLRAAARQPAATQQPRTQRRSCSHLHPLKAALSSPAHANCTADTPLDSPDKMLMPTLTKEGPLVACLPTSDTLSEPQSSPVYTHMRARVNSRPRSNHSHRTTAEMNAARTRWCSSTCRTAFVRHVLLAVGVPHTLRNRVSAGSTAG